MSQMTSTSFFPKTREIVSLLAIVCGNIQANSTSKDRVYEALWMFPERDFTSTLEMERAAALRQNPVQVILGIQPKNMAEVMVQAQELQLEFRGMLAWLVATAEKLQTAEHASVNGFYAAQAKAAYGSMPVMVLKTQKDLFISILKAADSPKKEYGRLAAQFHPDRGGRHEDMAALNLAYEMFK